MAGRAGGGPGVATPSGAAGAGRVAHRSGKAPRLGATEADVAPAERERSAWAGEDDPVAEAGGAAPAAPAARAAGDSAAQGAPTGSAPAAGSGGVGGGAAGGKAAAAKQPMGGSRKRRGQENAGEGIAPPQKRWFRQRAHVNPLSHNDAFDYPLEPAAVDWAAHYPAHFAPGEGGAALTPQGERGVRMADIGCGFGGLTMALGLLFPENLVLGMEIRDKVTEYVRLRIVAERNNADTHHNASVVKTNAMKYLPCLLGRGQLSHMFFCFPDPHFKTKNHKRRIISPTLLAEYAFALAPGGRLYTVTDVAELGEWMARHCAAHPCFRRATEEELKDDKAVPAVLADTEEGIKVARNKGDKHLNVFVRLTDEESDAAAAADAAAKGFWSTGGAAAAAAASGDGEAAVGGAGSAES